MGIEKKSKYQTGLELLELLLLPDLLQTGIADWGWRWIRYLTCHILGTIRRIYQGDISVLAITIFDILVSG